MRLIERLRDKYGFTGGITIVKDCVAGDTIVALAIAQERRLVN
jgi:hypothetical protein